MANDPSPKDPTLETYERIAAQRGAEHDANNPGWLSEYVAFRKALPEGRILEIGGGSGRDAERFLKDGYRYVGLEPCLGFAAQTAQRLHALHADDRWNVVAPATAADLPDLIRPQSFDGAWAMASLVHVPHARIFHHLEAIQRALKSGGILALTLKKGVGENIVDRSKDGVADRRFYAFHEPEEVLSRLTRLLLQPVENNGWIETHDGSTSTTWLSFLMRKR